MEPLSGHVVRDVVIEYADLSSHLLNISSEGRGDVHGVRIAHTHFRGGGTPVLTSRDSRGDRRRRDWTIEHSTGSAGGSPQPGFRLERIDGLVLRGNPNSFPARRAMTAAVCRQCTGVVDEGNRWPGAARGVVVTP